MQHHDRQYSLHSGEQHLHHEITTPTQNHMVLHGRLNETHPALVEGDGGFGSPSEANGGAPCYSADIWKEIDEEKDRLFDLMYKVQQKLVKDQTDQDAIDLRTCNWAQVMARVQMTGSRWKSRPSRQSKAMVFIDKVGQNSSALQSWLSLLPAGDYGSRYGPSSGLL